MWAPFVVDIHLQEICMTLLEKLYHIALKLQTGAATL